MRYNRDKEVNSALIRLMDALCMWERDAGRDSVLILAPMAPDESIILAQGGKPLKMDRTNLMVYLDLIKRRSGYV